MAKMTLVLPTGNNVTKEVWDTHTVDGWPVGPFFVHRRVGGKHGWTVTHINTKFAAQAGLRSKKRAMWLARKLGELDCWGFSNWKSAAKIPKETLAIINTLRADAMYGDMQGGEP